MPLLLAECKGIENGYYVFGWSGSGYVILDSGMGVGAYKISGGSNGAYLAMAVAQISILLVTLASAAAASSLLALVAAVGIGVYSMAAYTSSISNLTKAHKDGPLSGDQLNGLITMLSLLAVMANIIGLKGKINTDDIAKVEAAYYQVISVTIGLFVSNSVLEICPQI